MVLKLFSFVNTCAISFHIYPKLRPCGCCKHLSKCFFKSFFCRYKNLTLRRTHSKSMAVVNVKYQTVKSRDFSIGKVQQTCEKTGDFFSNTMIYMTLKSALLKAVFVAYILKRYGEREKNGIRNPFIWLNLYIFRWHHHRRTSWRKKQSKNLANFPKDWHCNRPFEIFYIAANSLNFLRPWMLIFFGLERRLTASK